MKSMVTLIALWVLVFVTLALADDADEKLQEKRGLLGLGYGFAGPALDATPVTAYAAPAPIAKFGYGLGYASPYAAPVSKYGYVHPLTTHAYAGLGYAAPVPKIGYAGLGYAGLGYAGLGYAGLGYAAPVAKLGYAGYGLTGLDVGYGYTHGLTYR